MKAVSLGAVGFWAISATAMAQSDSEALRLCTLPSYAERMKCLEELATGNRPSLPSSAATPVLAPSPDTAPARPAPPAVGGTPAVSPATLAKEWTVSETRSPVDYSPVAIATASASTGGNGVLQLSVECRSSRTEMIMRRTPTNRMVGDHTVIYKINDAPPAMVTIGLPSSRSGIELKGDVPGFLLALPPEGVITFSVTDRRGPTDAHYDLSGIKTMVNRMAEPCSWRRK